MRKRVLQEGPSGNNMEVERMQRKMKSIAPLFCVKEEGQEIRGEAFGTVSRKMAAVQKWEVKMFWGRIKVQRKRRGKYNVGKGAQYRGTLFA